MLLAALALAADIAASPIPLDRARRTFDEIRIASEEDGGRLWGTALYGPMLFVDPETRAVVANRADPEGRLIAENGLFVGSLPPTVAVANTAVRWAGVEWTMILWDAVGERAVARRRLLLHESFHRIQDEIGFPLAPADNAHLDTLEGRIWLILEMRALAAALRDKNRATAMADAVAFRAKRRALFAQAAANEQALENNEGLAEYTGFALRGTSDEETRLAVARWRLGDDAGSGTFVRSFAYATGPAWGLLLDEVAPGWRARFKAADDLAAVAAETAKLAAPADVDARAAVYDGKRLRAAEERREKERFERIARYRARLVDGPLFLIPTAIGSFGFDPNTVVPLGEHGTVHPHLTVTGDWGEITTESGARLPSDGSAIVFSAEDLPRLKLQAGWVLRAAPRAGDLVLVRTPNP
jgi:hypothetical protein